MIPRGTDASVQTYTPKLTESRAKASQKPVINKKPDKPLPNHSAKSSNKVLSDRFPNGSDDQIQQHYRFQCLDEAMEADIDLGEQNTNKHGRIIKRNKR